MDFQKITILLAKYIVSKNRFPSLPKMLLSTQHSADHWKWADIPRARSRL